jgi:hypothetical protein
METSNKTISVNISDQQYQHISQLASLVETLTDQHTDAETIIAKLLTRSLSNLEIGKPKSECKSENLTEPITVHIPEQNNLEAQQEIEPGEKPIEAIEKKASPESIMSIVSSLQESKTAIQPKQQQVENFGAEPMKELSITWARFIGKPTRGMKMAIVGDNRYNLSRLAISLSYELNRSYNTLYIAPTLVGEFRELAKHFRVDTRIATPKETKVIHYLPETTTVWKRIICNGEKQYNYSAIFFDGITGMQLKPKYANELPTLLGDPQLAVSMAQIYVVGETVMSKKTVEEWANEMDIVITCFSREVVLIKNNFATADSMQIGEGFEY